MRRVKRNAAGGKDGDLRSYKVCTAIFVVRTEATTPGEVTLEKKIQCRITMTEAGETL